MTALKLTVLTDNEIDRVLAGLGTEGHNLMKRMRNADLWKVEVAFPFSLLSAAAKINIWTPATKTQTIKIRQILLSGAGTSFGPVGGDRNLSLTDGTSTWTAIPAATLKALAAGFWGSAGVPFPATPAHLLTASVANTSVYLQYSGGTTDYTSGSGTMLVMYEIVSE